ncbi:hypothetical protein AKJ62_03235 [candidate division MSBL1 archaeon SCGC-AAA259D14]|uniref:TIGR00267 family protein n=2 Tax=candidate division MSBL1 TaxID=215777 RepID=A0A133U5C7_9EURY|nr:hypothetical protein AKJ62_03235 [candidate division MSBL1 archaeon SCGC-AAA259D14]KXA92484.1 hypothetical protein AKJ66_04095 [candidate division MSBL1 archaeon SCGC-AAA259E22]
MDRYLIRGFIDGLLSTLGVVIGASIAITSGGTETVQAGYIIIIASGLGGGIANGLSNVLGAFMGEKAAMYERYKKVEKAMLRDDVLKGTKVDERIQDKILTSGVADGLSTIGGAIIPIIPFLFVPIFTLTPMFGLYLSILVSLVLFFVLGIYIGKVSKENIILSGLKMVAFGGATTVIVGIISLILPA